MLFKKRAYVLKRLQCVRAVSGATNRFFRVAGDSCGRQVRKHCQTSADPPSSSTTDLQILKNVVVTSTLLRYCGKLDPKPVARR